MEEWSSWTERTFGRGAAAHTAKWEEENAMNCCEERPVWFRFGYIRDIIGASILKDVSDDKKYLIYHPKVSLKEYCEGLRKGRSMYLIDFLKKFLRKANRTAWIYLFLNVLLIALAVFVFSPKTKTFGSAFVKGIFLYAVSVAVAMSQFGEFILRWQTGCRKIKDERQKKIIEPIYKEVYSKARKLDPTIPSNVQLYINEEKGENACTIGRKTVCITGGLLDVPEEQIKAILGHEFGHLAHKDTYATLFLCVGNLTVTFFITVIMLILTIPYCIVEAICRLLRLSITEHMTKVHRMIISSVVNFLYTIWGRLGELFVGKTSRENEYEADEFSYKLGYGEDFCNFLRTYDGQKANGIFAALGSSHPDSADRIARLQILNAGGGDTTEKW